MFSLLVSSEESQSAQLEESASETIGEQPVLPGEPVADPPRRDPITLVFAILIFLVSITVFFPAVHNELLPWDDQHNIVQNPYLVPLSSQGLLHLWTHVYDRLYVPLFYSSFSFDILLSGAQPWFIHLVNLVLHALSAAVVLQLLTLLLRAVDPSGDQILSRRRAMSIAAFLGALVFAFHPLQAEPVAWATGRKDLLLGLFSFTALWQFVAWRTRGARLGYELAFLSFVLALLSKPAAVSLPVGVLVIDTMVLRRSVRESLGAVAPWLVLAFGWTILSMQGQAMTPQLAAVQPELWQRPLLAADVLAFYLRKLLCPLHLAAVYGRMPREVVAGPAAYVRLAALVAALCALVRCRGALAASAAFSIAMLLPVLGLVGFDYQINSTVADRYMYVPMLGVGLAVALVLYRLMRTAPSTAYGALAFAMLFLAAMAGLSLRQTIFWKDSHSLWLHALEIAPGSAVVQSNVGMVYTRENQNQQAEAAFREALRIRPDFTMAHTNLANLLSDSGRQQEALTHYDAALKSEPEFIIARTGLSMTYLSMQRLDDAAREARRALKSQPGFLVALDCLIKALGPQGRIKEALPEIRAAIQADPGNNDLRTLLEQVQKQ